jgi:hypothetical protein
MCISRSSCVFPRSVEVSLDLLGPVSWIKVILCLVMDERYPSAVSPIW